jgi:hypothetical protein
VFKRNKAKKEPNPSQYPDRVLKALVREYDSNLNVRSKGIPESMLAIKAGIVDDYQKQLAPNKWAYGDFVSEMTEAVRILLERGDITVVGCEGSVRLIKPTLKAIDSFHWQARWYYKVIGFIRWLFVTVVEGVTKGLTRP